MARLNIQISNLLCTRRARSYFSDGLRPYLLVRLECARGLATAEYAPLRGIHAHDIHEVKTMLDALGSFEIDRLLGLDPSLDYFKLAQLFSKHWRYPVSWILSCLFYNLHINHNKFFIDHKIKISALMLEGLYDFDYFASNNYNIFKLKIGENIGEEIIKINNLKSRMSHPMLLRLDANRRLSFEEAGRLVRGIEGPEIVQYFEEPLIDPSFLSHFFDSYGVACALDESFSEASSWEYIQALKARYLIFKPSRFSSVYHVIACAKEAQARKIKPILSTCFESSYSTALFALLASELNVLDDAHGIWCEGFFNSNELESPFVKAPGYLYVSQALRYLSS